MIPEASRDEPLWFKDAIFYELRIRSYADSNADGIGDFKGATEKLEYLRDLGVTLIWLLPFFPSPGRDDGYDISGYMNVHPDVGTLDDFKEFLETAHRLGLKVMIELVINHTSDQHPWFQRARRAPANSPERDYYVWSDTPDRFPEARIIFQDFERSNWTWDPIANAYFWHRFFSHQPDLNYDNPQVQSAILEILDFWLGLGVDGLRLDAVPYLFERDGTMCENLPEGHEYLKRLRAYIDERYENRVLLAEANQWPEDAAAYFGDGDECHMAFHFPIMPRLYMALHMEERFPIIDILNQTPEIPDSCQWAIFLRNHDELTLEMVTEEERDYMYRVYAQDKLARINLGIRRRLAPLLGNDRKKIELMNALLLSLPGTPVLYYGDEIGMGDNFYLGDRNGVRTPMQWSYDRNAGFSQANPQQLVLPVITDPEYHYETINVEAQQRNPHSLLWWTKRIIALRKQYQAFGRGQTQFLYPENSRILAFLRRHEDETILVVCNLSRFVQYLELDLSDYAGYTPVELFGGNPFPQIDEHHYFLTLGPHGFYWFLLRPAKAGESPTPEEEEQRALAVRGDWTALLNKENVGQLEAIMPAYLQSQRWFQSKARRMTSIHVQDVIPIHDSSAHFVLFNVSYSDSDEELYLLPLDFAAGEEADELRHHLPSAIIARMSAGTRDNPQTGILFDAIARSEFCITLAHLLLHGQRMKGRAGTVETDTTPLLAEVWDDEAAQHPVVLGYEQSNTSIRYGEQFILKLMRKAVRGVNPELEIGRFLMQHPTPTQVPPLLGSLEYHVSRADEPFTLGVLQNFVPNQGDAWRHTLSWLGRFFDEILASSAGESRVALPELPEAGLVELAQGDIPQHAQETIGSYLADAALLGQRTAELHVALSSDHEDRAFAPEPFTTLYQRSLYQSMRNLTNRIFRLLNGRNVPEEIAADVSRMADYKDPIIDSFQALTRQKLTGMRIRCHGDYHLGQVLYTGSDFIIIDFEGEPGRTLSERRIKQSPLRDVAGMLRSFHYAAYAALPGYGVQHTGRLQDLPIMEPWARYWQTWSSVAFLRAYLENVADAKILPQSQDELHLLLQVLLLEKAVYELGYELNNRPGWVKVPMQAILQQFEQD